jgi:hypothetical protein
MNKRINIVLPERTSKTLRERLKNEALVNAERDVAISTEWSALEEEALEHKPERSDR